MKRLLPFVAALSVAVSAGCHKTPPPVAVRVAPTPAPPAASAPVAHPRPPVTVPKVPRHKTTPLYSVTDLGVLPGSLTSQGNAINNHGQVTGTLMLKDGGNRAFLYSDGKMRDLGTLGGHSSFGNAINDRGEVAGSAYVASSDYVSSQRAFLFSRGKMRNLGTITINEDGRSEELPDSYGLGINNRGQVCGYAEEFSGPLNPFLYSRGRLHDLSLFKHSKSDNELPSASSINDRGWILIGGTPYGMSSAPYVCHGGRFHRLPKMKDCADYQGVGINNQNDVVGMAQQEGKDQRHGFWYHAGKMRDIGEIAGYDSVEVKSINNQGGIVGRAYNSNDDQPPLGQAFLYAQGSVRDLNDLISADSGWVLESANGINDKAQIVGTGLHDGQRRAFVLTPVGVK